MLDLNKWSEWHSFPPPYQESHQCFTNTQWNWAGSQLQWTYLLLSHLQIMGDRNFLLFFSNLVQEKNNNKEKKLCNSTSGVGVPSLIILETFIQSFRYFPSPIKDLDSFLLDCFLDWHHDINKTNRWDS